MDMLKNSTIIFNQYFGQNEEISLGKLSSVSGNGKYTKLCHEFFKSNYGFKHCLLTTSCTDALEMSAILANIQANDEVILPAYTFVSTANAFVLRGAKLIFADSGSLNPNITAETIEPLITNKTKAIVVVHYAGVACDMDSIMALASKHNILLIEDAAQAIDAFYINHHNQKLALGSIGNMGAMSFHETKNITCGEGGLLIVNDEQFIKRSEIIWEKGTNRSAFFRGEVDKYGWVDIGSSFLPSELNAAFLSAQLESIQLVQTKRLALWAKYYEVLKPLEDKALLKLPVVPDFAIHNAHMFYILLQDLEQRTGLINHLKAKGIQTAFHYLSLHSSQYFKDQYCGPSLVNSDCYTDTLLRLPMHYYLSEEDIMRIADEIQYFFGQ